MDASGSAQGGGSVADADAAFPPTCWHRIAGCARMCARIEDSAMQQVKGTFQVKRTGQSAIDDAGEGADMARIRLEKTFQGALDATSVVEMMSVGTAVQGSAAYVALEHVIGRLDGRKGSFALQHSGTMDRGTPSLSVMVVPDSGTGELRGLTGTLGIDIVDGKHYYTFDFDLDPARS
jgi:uncharacterized protein DUF3224